MLQIERCWTVPVQLGVRLVQHAAITSTHSYHAVHIAAKGIRHTIRHSWNFSHRAARLTLAVPVIGLVSTCVLVPAYWYGVPPLHAWLTGIPPMGALGVSPLPKPPTKVPEPGSILVFAVGVVCTIALFYKKRIKRGYRR